MRERVGTCDRHSGKHGLHSMWDACENWKASPAPQPEPYRGRNGVNWEAELEYVKELDAKSEQPSPPAGAREHKENEVMKTIRDANGTTIWWGKPLAGRGEAAEQEQNKAGISASSGTTFITSSAPNERPASSPAGARESAEQFFNSLPEETKYKWAGEVKPHWAFEFAEAYAKKERERADAAERERDEFGTTIVRLDRALEFRQKECESLRTELREMREALEHITQVRACAKIEALLSRKGESK